MKMTIPSLEQEWSKDFKFQTTGAVYFLQKDGLTLGGPLVLGCIFLFTAMQMKVAI